MQEKIQQLLQDALACQQRGDLAGAEQACRTILELDGNQADALQFLGLIEETKGNLAEARELMEKSLAVYPNQPHVLNNLANLFHDTGESEKAIEFRCTRSGWADLIRNFIFNRLERRKKDMLYKSCQKFTRYQGL